MHREEERRWKRMIDLRQNIPFRYGLQKSFIHKKLCCFFTGNDHSGPSDLVSCCQTENWFWAKQVNAAWFDFICLLTLHFLAICKITLITFDQIFCVENGSEKYRSALLSITFSVFVFHACVDQMM